MGSVNSYIPSTSYLSPAIIEDVQIEVASLFSKKPNKFNRMGGISKFFTLFSEQSAGVLRSHIFPDGWAIRSYELHHILIVICRYISNEDQKNIILVSKDWYNIFYLPNFRYIANITCQEFGVDLSKCFHDHKYFDSSLQEITSVEEAAGIVFQRLAIELLMEKIQGKLLKRANRNHKVCRYNCSRLLSFITCTCCCWFLWCTNLEIFDSSYAPMNMAISDVFASEPLIKQEIAKQAACQWFQYISSPRRKSLQRKRMNYPLWINHIKNILCGRERSSTHINNWIYINPAKFQVIWELEQQWYIIWNECKELLRIPGCYETRFTEYIDEDILLTRNKRIFHEKTTTGACTVYGRWKLFRFYASGKKLESNCSLAPRTAYMLENIPNLSVAGFSVLEPKSYIKHHKCYNTTSHIRFHLGLSIPDQCGFSARTLNDSYQKFDSYQNHDQIPHIPVGVVRNWKEGRILAFNGNTVHEAWNFSTDKLFVLMLDFVRNRIPRHKLPTRSHKKCPILY